MLSIGGWLCCKAVGCGKVIKSADNFDDDNHNNEKVSKASTLQLKVLNNTNIKEHV